MAPRAQGKEWAEKVAVRKYGNKGWHIPYAAGLVSEHARAIRIVKAEIKRVKMDQFSYNADEKCVIVNSLESVLATLQRGRGGKG